MTAAEKVRHPTPRTEATGGASLACTKVTTFGLAVYASHSYLKRKGTPRRPITGLRGHDIVVSSKTGPGAKWNATLKPPAEEVLVAFPYEATMAAVVSGLGLALLPCVMADGRRELKRVSRVLLSWDLWVVSPTAEREHLRARSVRESLIQMICDSSAQLSGLD